MNDKVTIKLVELLLRYGGTFPYHILWKDIPERERTRLFDWGLIKFTPESVGALLGDAEVYITELGHEQIKNYVEGNTDGR